MLTKSTQFANRFGLNTKLYSYGSYTGTDEDTPVMVIDFANVSEINLEGDTTWATGGQARSNQVGFNNPYTGSFKLTTQIITPEVLTLLAGKDVKDATNKIEFENTASSTISPYYTITSETVWQDKEGNKISQNLVFHKARVKRSLNLSYDGAGDPTEIEIEFELAANDNGKVLVVEHSDGTQTEM